MQNLVTQVVMALLYHDIVVPAIFEGLRSKVV